jgi:sphingolipid delta-4 desaturase
MPRSNYLHVPSAQPHIARHRDILRAHPEVRELTGATPSSMAWIVALVLTQFALALLVGHRAWWIWLLVAYLAGATIDHALWVLIHECTHNLVFRSASANKLAAIVANFPIVLPASLAFRAYHLLHHQHLGELDFDADLPGPSEARVIHTSFAKAVWIAAFGGVQGVLRPHRLTQVKAFDRWIGLNIAVQLAALVLFYVGTGAGPIAYLLASSIFAVGFHPLGARWIQEHFIFKNDQETYSYYGPLNRVCFNVGFHNEHHDFVTIPWSRLPALKAAAPEFYDTLYAHHSWTRLLFRFIFDRECGLYDRVIRKTRE